MKTAIKTMSDQEREVFREVWLERLIRTRVADGAKIPAKKRKQLGPIDLDKPEQSNQELDAPVRRVRTRVSKSAPLVIELDDSDSDEFHPSVPVTTPPSRSPTPPPRVTELKQGTLDGHWKKLTTREEKNAHIKRTLKNHRAAMEGADRKEKKKQAKKVEWEQMLARERQRRHREKKQAETKDGDGDARPSLNDVLGKSAASALALEDVPTLSRSATDSTWRKTHNGNKGGAKQGKAKRTNYYHPFMWTIIERAVHRADWSSEGTSKILKREYPMMFSKINQSTIWKWMDRERPRHWSEETLGNVRRFHALAGSGRTGILAQCPEVTNQIVKTLKDLRISGIPVSVRKFLLDDQSCLPSFMRKPLTLSVARSAALKSLSATLTRAS